MISTSTTYQSSDGASYERFLGRWTKLLARELVGFAGVHDAGAILDVGTGTGSLALELARASPDAQVVGVDISDAYIAYAASTKLPNLHFELGDATKLGYPDSSFDAVLSQLVLNFIPDYRQAAQEMKRVTKRDGIIAAAVWDFRGGLVYQRLLWDSIVSTDPPSAAVRDRLFSHPLGIGGGLESLWTEIGLAQIESRSLTIRMDFADFADYWEPLLGGQGPVGTYVAGLPPDQAVRVREQVRDAYLSGAADGPRSMTATAWAVRGIVP